MSQGDTDKYARGRKKCIICKVATYVGLLLAYIRKLFGLQESCERY